MTRRQDAEGHFRTRASRGSGSPPDGGGAQDGAVIRAARLLRRSRLGRGWPPVLLAVAVNALLGWASRAGEPRLVWLHPVAPPLTRIAALGDRTLDPGAAPPPGDAALIGAVEQVVRAVGEPAQRRALEEALRASAGAGTLAARSLELRLLVEEDAVLLAEALGPARVGAIVARKEVLAERVGEGRVWDEAAARTGR